MSSDPAQERERKQKNQVLVSIPTLHCSDQLHPHYHTLPPTHTHVYIYTYIHTYKTDQDCSTGRTIYPQLSLAERLRQVGKPSRAAASESGKRITNQRPDVEPQDTASHFSTASASSNDVLTPQFKTRLRTPHPLLEHLPESIDGSVSPGSTRENSPQQRHTATRSRSVRLRHSNRAKSF